MVMTYLYMISQEYFWRASGLGCVILYGVRQKEEEGRAILYEQYVSHNTHEPTQFSLLKPWYLKLYLGMLGRDIRGVAKTRWVFAPGSCRIYSQGGYPGSLLKWAKVTWRWIWQRINFKGWVLNHKLVICLEDPKQGAISTWKILRKWFRIMIIKRKCIAGFFQIKQFSVCSRGCGLLTEIIKGNIIIWV